MPFKNVYFNGFSMLEWYMTKTNIYNICFLFTMAYSFADYDYF